MISFPAATWQSALVKKTTNRRPKDAGADETYGRVATAITPRLYLSDLHTARAPGNLERLGITHIVSAIEADVHADLGETVIVMHVPIRDNSDVDISRWFDEVVKFIQNALDTDENHKVLVHCFQGISRSATLVCAYLVATTPMGALDALAHVQAKRGIVAPNLGFRRQLVTWGHQFDEAKARAEEERRRRGRSVGVIGGVLSRWMSKTKSGGETKHPRASLS
ncbi:protein-tyrosine phosphatase-like protein [Melanogaster broomeanus]|nr:protein-tyrosine phosphatase-like protein [Melanogaster broomeanus]